MTRFGMQHYLSRALALLFLLAVLPWATVVGQPVFTDVTASAGLTYLQHTARVPPACIYSSGGFCEPERMSGGAATGDIDGDGDLDVYVTRVDASDIMFCNQLADSGVAEFTDCTTAAGLAAFAVQSNGAAFSDIDNDGDLDLYVAVLGEANDPANNRNYLFINDGSGAFTDDATSRGAAIANTNMHRTYGVTFADYDKDGWVDIHLNEWAPGTVSHSRLLRNIGTTSPGFFTDETAAAGVELNGIFAFASTFTDLDHDGWPDLAVAGDFGTSQLFWNDGDGTFTEDTIGAGVGTDENGMGSTFGDYDADGDLDWFVTSIFDADETCETETCMWGYTGNRLYRNEGGRTFSDATDSAGVRDGAWGWGAVFFDYDNDGDLDLVMTNGVDFPAATVEDVYNTDLMRFWENDGTGSMQEKGAAVGIDDAGSGKGLLSFDYDNDGDLDLLVINNADAPVLYRNDGGNSKGWLRVKTTGTLSNREGLGAKIIVRASSSDTIGQIREIGTQSHFLGYGETTAHFGLGSGTAPVHKVTVVWPAGGIQTFSGVTRNATLVATEPADNDADNDGVIDAEDNCYLTANADQRDTNGDGYGNICDADFNGNGVVDPADFSLLKSRFGRPGFPDQDLNGNGIVDPFDFSLLKSKFGQPAGPSGNSP